MTSAFTVFVADYAERRAQLIRADRELNLIRRGQLASTRLGQLALSRSLGSMAAPSTPSFLGAALPLLLGALLPVPSWTVIVLVIAALMALGAVLARLHVGPVVWCSAGMGLGGGAVTWIGIQLHIT
ncbi:hypothetical protein [Streptomyces sp. NPDC058424]|uniref:hypothetical protein n=1 Tax=Streptomyces sp. NPDC058424 TaxID=3346491 RepID=UPI0036562CD4